MPNKLEKLKSLGKGLLHKFVEQQFHFRPYLKPLSIRDLNAVFYYGTPQASEWYDPIKPYALLEYNWVLENIELKNKKIIDGGCHHGQYSVVLAKGSGNTAELVAVDPFPMNCLLTNINRCLNDLNFKILEKAISEKETTLFFSDQSNGHLTSNGKLKVESTTLYNIMPDAEIIKLDVEGEEFKIIPNDIERMSKVTTWIVEVHPSNQRIPDDLIKVFLNNNYEIFWINRENNQVEKYNLNSEWRSHSTVFCLKR
ncbi:MAG: FkbM family methyltransferase [Bacteroidia bacterium]